MIIIVFGLPGSGKSFFASRLAALIKADYINSDRIRKEMLAERTYSDNEKQLVYNEMLIQMRKGIAEKKSLVLDATFYLEKTRIEFKDNAMGNREIIFMEVTADEGIIRKRLGKTRLESDADFKVYEKIKLQWEPFNDPHLVLHSTDDNIEDMLLEASIFLDVKNDERTDK